MTGLARFPPGTADPRTSSSNPMTLIVLSSDPATDYGVIDYQDDDRPDGGDDHAVEIEAGNPIAAQGAEDEARRLPLPNLAAPPLPRGAFPERSAIIDDYHPCCSVQGTPTAIRSWRMIGRGGTHMQGSG
jgi:hypothetical protein